MRQMPLFVVCLAFLLGSGASAYAVEQKPVIFLVDPPKSTANISSIAVRGVGWGAFKDRESLRGWLVDPDTNEFHELVLYRNYRDCSFFNTEKKIEGECNLSRDELFARFDVPIMIQQQLKAKKYGLYIKTENNLEAVGVFTVLEKPAFDTAKGSSLALIPDRGLVGTYTVLFGAGFSPGQVIDFRFDGVWQSLGGSLRPDEDGGFENIGFVIPKKISKNGKTVAVTAGQHVLSVSNGDQSAQAIFIVEDDDAEKKKEAERLERERKKKEQEEKKRLQEEQERLRKEQEKIKREEERLEGERKRLEEELKKKKRQEQKEKDDEERARLEAERKKLEEKLKKKQQQEDKKEQKIEDIKKRQEEINERFCDPELPITFQPGCIQKKITPPKSKYEGKPCQADLPITFQPGCVAQKPEEQKKLFEGKACSPDIPRVWQEGCIETVPSSTEPASAGVPCKPDTPITFQPGCVDSTVKTGRAPSGKQYCDPARPLFWQSGCEPQPQQPAVETKSHAGKPCDPNVPRFWQEGCVDR